MLFTTKRCVKPHTQIQKHAENSRERCDEYYIGTVEIVASINMLPCITNNVTTISHFISSNLLQNGGKANNPAYCTVSLQYYSTLNKRKQKSAVVEMATNSNSVSLCNIKLDTTITI